MSWKLTKAREVKEGRNIPKIVFVEDFFNAKANVNRAKEIFGDKVHVNLIIKDYENKNDFKLEFNIPNIDNYFEFKYDKKTLLGDIDKI